MCGEEHSVQKDYYALRREGAGQQFGCLRSKYSEGLCYSSYCVTLNVCVRVCVCVCVSVYVCACACVSALVRVCVCTCACMCLCGFKCGGVFVSSTLAVATPCACPCTCNGHRTPCPPPPPPLPFFFLSHLSALACVKFYCRCELLIGEPPNLSYSGPHLCIGCCDCSHHTVSRKEESYISMKKLQRDGLRRCRQKRHMYRRSFTAQHIDNHNVYAYYSKISLLLRHGCHVSHKVGTSHGEE